MKHLLGFKIFEDNSEYNHIWHKNMGRLLHLYGSIPLTKEKSSIVIKKILSSAGLHYNIGDDIDLNRDLTNTNKIHDKVRFKDYFDSMLSSKDTRGPNFEGFISGIYNGELSNQLGSKHDMTIGDFKYSLKFTETASKAPEIGSSYLQNMDFSDDIKDLGNLTHIFLDTVGEIIDLKELNKLKRKIFAEVSRDIDMWVLCYPNRNKKSGEIESITINTINKPQMRNLLFSGCVSAPKSGYLKPTSNPFALALSPNYKKTNWYDSSTIILPKVSLKEIQNLNSVTDDSWVNKVFGEAGYKMRPDVLDYIKNNAQKIITKMSKYLVNNKRK